MTAARFIVLIPVHFIEFFGGPGRRQGYGSDGESVQGTY
jgi:hypothetical protein